MKKIFLYVGVAAVSFISGAVTGWFVRKKTSEVQFEEISAEEQAAQIAYDMGISRPADIKEAIDKTFGVTGQKAASEAKEGRSENDIPGGTIDTQKVNYMKKWKAEEAADKYDTRTKETPKNVVTHDEDDDDLEAGIDKELLDQMTTAARVYGGKLRNGPDIEAGSMEDWDHWLGESDGDYDPVEIWWFDVDNVLTDSEGRPLENPGKYIGFDVEQKFNEIDEDTTGDPDVRVIYNHRSMAIFQIVRRHMSYDRKTHAEEYGSDDEDLERIHARYE